MCELCCALKVRKLMGLCSAAPEGQKKNCPMDPFQIVHERCIFVDHQTIKLQEPPDMVPVGELPRHMLLSADRYGPVTHD